MIKKLRKLKLKIQREREHRKDYELVTCFPSNVSAHAKPLFLMLSQCYGFTSALDQYHIAIDRETRESLCRAGRPANRQPLDVIALTEAKDESTFIARLISVPCC